MDEFIQLSGVGGVALFVRRDSVTAVTAHARAADRCRVHLTGDSNPLVVMGAPDEIVGLVASRSEPSAPD
jgi:hypothetical protein